MRDLDDRVLVELHRAAVLARRPGIAVVSTDAERADEVTGSRARTHRAIARLARSGRVVPVRRDLLVLRNEIGVAQATLLELIDAIAPGDYVVTGGHALHARGLAAERSSEVVVLVARPATDFSWGRQHTRHLRVHPDRVWGGERLRGNPARPGPLVALPERALLDAFAHERFGVPLPLAVRALAAGLSEDAGLGARLAGAARRYDVAAVARRAGLLVEHVAGADAAAPFLDLIGASPSPVLLRAGGAASGPVDRRWRVRVNAELG